MFASFKNDSYPLEWICKVYTENMKTKEIKNIKDVLKRDIREYVEALYQLNPKSILGLITKGLHHFDNGEYFEALDIFTAVNEIKPNWATCLRMLVQVYVKFRASQMAERFYKELNGELHYIYFKPFQTVIIVTHFVAKDIPFIRCLLENGKKDEALRLIEDLKDSCEEDKRAELLHLSVWCKLLSGKQDFETDLEDLQRIDENWFIKTNILQKRFV